MSSSTALTTRQENGSPYQLDLGQVLRASAALTEHIKSEKKRRLEEGGKRNLLEDVPDSSDAADDTEDIPIWLSVTTKKHVIDKRRLKPSKIALPHSLHASSSASPSKICLITADPQRIYKDLIAEPSFPLSLSTRINRVIGITKLKARYKSYESRRQLFAESDIFLADDRIVTYLPHLLGKVFYHGGAKRPIPVSITAKPSKDKDGKKVKSKSKEGEGKGAATPADAAKEIERTLNTALVHLSPSTNTAIKIGKASFTAEQIAANVEAVVHGLVERFIPKGWRNIRAIHIKGPNTMALPIWLADELWVDERDVLEPKPAMSAEAVKAIEDKKKQKAKEHKRKRSVWDAFEEEETTNPPKKSKAEVKEEQAEARKKEIASRKETLRAQKVKAIATAEA